jgi:hypothetical protein
MPLAAAGSPEARARLIDAYSELTSVLAVWLRPSTMMPARAVALAQEELEAIVAWPMEKTSIVVTLVQRISGRLSDG